MPTDNPFFNRELRQHQRRRSGVLVRLLAGLLLWSLTVAVSLLVSPFMTRQREALFGHASEYAGALVLIHAGCCIAAGIYGADLVLAREIRRNTLAQLRVIELAAGRMLALKLAFPFGMIGVVWSAGIPLALIAVVLDAVSFAGAARGLGFAAWCGLAAFWLALLFPGGHSLDEKYLQRHGRASWKWPYCAGLSTAAGVLLGMATLKAWEAPDRWPLFGFRINAWIPAGALLALVAGAAVLSVEEQLAGKEVERGRLDGLLVWGLPLTLILGLGGIWPGMPTWLRWLAVIVLGLLCLGGSLHLAPEKKRKEPEAEAKAGPRRESPWLEAELAWLAARWSNPLFLRDLRASCRTGSLRTRTRNRVILGLLQVGFLSLLLKPFGTWVFGWAGGAYFGPLFRAGDTAATLWEKEQSSGSRALLLATPLSERALLLGRLLASVVKALPDLVFPTLVLWGCATWLAATRYWPVVPMLLSALPVLLSVWIIGGCRKAFPAGEQFAFRRNRFLFLIVGLELLLIPGGIYTLHHGRERGPVFCYGVVPLLILFHLGFAILLFRGYEYKLRAYRREDVDLAAV